MAFTSLKVDQVAHDLVLKCCHEYPKGIKESYKMRMTVAYGLERFWGEQFRLKGDKARYWLETWTKLVEIMGDAGIEIPNDDVSSGEPAAISRSGATTLDISPGTTQSCISYINPTL